MTKITLSENLAISETGFLFLPTTGESFTVNEVGKEILTTLREGKSEAEIVQQILRDYDVDPATTEHDLRDFITQLRQMKLAVVEAE